MYKQLHAVFLIAGFLACTFVAVEADVVCDPRTFNQTIYSATLQSLTIIGTQPLKVAAYFRINNSTEEFIMTGMIYSENFESDHALTACRSIGCSQVSSLSQVSWEKTATCKFQCPDGRSAMRACAYILKDFSCASDAMDLAECVTGPFWPSVDPYGPYSYGTNLVCTNCAGN